MHSKKILIFLAFLIVAASLFKNPSVQAYTLSGGRLVEDFSTDDFADYSSTTGLWNTVDRIARAGAVAGGSANRPLSFGDGSDGVLDTSGGYVFNTDSHPNGYNFKSVNISGGTIEVQGSSPLIIRSLGAVNIAAAISVDGGTGGPGVPDGVTSAPAGGTRRACTQDGGAGGAADALTASAGGAGVRASGAVENAGGAAGTGAAGSDGQASTTGPLADLDATNGFICGTGGAGGGGHTDPGNFSTGGAGGAGGGAIRIIALGNISVAGITATGGNGGDGVADAIGGNAHCSGNGAGGSGGAVWLQTLKTLTTTIDPVADGGTGGTACLGGVGQSVNGRLRGDSASASRPVWATGGACPAAGATTNCDTDNAAANQTYIVQSKGYDLGTLNASFPSSPSVTSIANGGSITVQYAASTDGATYSGFTNDLTSLSNKNYRFLKFRISITTAAAAAASPQVSQIAIDYKDLGREKLEYKISAGCGSIAALRQDGDGGDDDGATGLKHTAFWLLAWCLAYIMLRLRPKFR
ncbi:MAG: hypothetical protein AB1540_11260 [Bdellovibrionota bacterium]